MELFLLKVTVLGIVVILFAALFAITTLCFLAVKIPCFCGASLLRFCIERGVIEKREYFDQKAYDAWAAAIKKLCIEKKNRRFLVADGMFTTTTYHYCLHNFELRNSLFPHFHTTIVKGAVGALYYEYKHKRLQ